MINIENVFRKCILESAGLKWERLTLSDLNISPDTTNHNEIQDQL